jgi:hypothetical protein
MGLQMRVDTAVESAATLMPFSTAVFLRRQRPKKIAQEAQLVAGQWAEILTARSATPLHGFVFSIRPGEVLFTFPDLAACPSGLEPGRGLVVCYAGRTGRHTAQTAILRVAKGPPVTVAVQHLSNVATEQRRRYPRVSLKIPATLVAAQSSGQAAAPQSDERARIRNLGVGGMLLETSLSLAAGDSVNVTLPESSRAVARHNGSRQVIGKVLRVEKTAEGRRKPKVASVEFSFNSDDERDGWAQLVLAQQRRR